MIRAQVYSSEFFTRIEVGAVGPNGFLVDAVEINVTSSAVHGDTRILVSMASKRLEPSEAVFQAALFRLTAEMAVVLDRNLRTEGMALEDALDALQAHQFAASLLADVAIDEWVAV